jgi:hypothetical protein
MASAPEFALTVNETKLPAFGLKLTKDGLHRFNHGRKIGDRFFAECDSNVAERYVRGELEISFDLRRCGAMDREQFRLVFLAVPSGTQVGSRKESSPGHAHACCELYRSDWSRDCVLIGITDFVECKEKITPSLVWLVRTKKRPQFLRNIGASPFRLFSKGGRIARERKVSVRQFSFAASAPRNGVQRMVKRFPEILGDVSGQFGNRIGQLFDKAHLAYDKVRFIRVGLGDNFVALFFDSDRCAPLECGKVARESLV